MESEIRGKKPPDKGEINKNQAIGNFKNWRNLKKRRNRGEVYVTSPKARKKGHGWSEVCKRECHQEVDVNKRTELFHLLYFVAAVVLVFR